MAKRSRNELKNLFRKGAFPTEANFWDLIESTVNKRDDGFDKDAQEGMRIHTLGTSKNLMSFYEKAEAKDPQWRIQVNHDESNKGLSFADSQRESRLFLADEGKIGMGTSAPDAELTVEGGVSMVYRMGGFKRGRLLANRQWHTVVDGLTGYNILEVAAQVGAYDQRGKYAVAHVMAVNAFGKGKIRMTQSNRGFFWNKLQFRWRGDYKNYRLEMRSRIHFPGEEDDKLKYVQFHVTKMWNNDFNFEKQYDQRGLEGSLETKDTPTEG